MNPLVNETGKWLGRNADAAETQPRRYLVSNQYEGRGGKGERGRRERGGEGEGGREQENERPRAPVLVARLTRLTHQSASPSVFSLLCH